MSGDDTDAIVSSLNLLSVHDNFEKRFAASISIVDSAFQRFRPQKTIAASLPQAGNTIHAAVSGWSTWSHNLPEFDQVLQANMLREVNRLMEQIGHPLSPHDFDGEVLGRYNACHAERLLIAHQNLNSVIGTLYIMINNKPCEDCYESLARLELILGMEVAIFSSNSTVYMEEKNRALYKVWLSMFADFY